jgi:hypothetical protein
LLVGSSSKTRKPHTCVRPYETQVKCKGGQKQAYSKHVDEQCKMNTLAARLLTKERKKKRREASVRGVADP